MKVSYSSSTQSRFDTLLANSNLRPGCLYYLKDNGKILRATSINTYESYSSLIHLIPSFPDPNPRNEHLYVTMEGKAKLYKDGVWISVSGGGTSDTSELAEAVAELQSRLTWKDIINEPRS